MILQKTLQQKLALVSKRFITRLKFMPAALNIKLMAAPIVPFK
jgi:hypothetical protein